MARANWAAEAARVAISMVEIASSWPGDPTVTR